MTAGISIRTDIAVIPRQSDTNEPVNSYSAGGNVREAGVRVMTVESANSFQLVRKAKIPLAATPGRARGRPTRKNDVQREQPSIRAASSSSSGTARKKPPIGQAVKGMFTFSYPHLRAPGLGQDL